MARLSDSITYGNHAITGDVDVGGDQTVDGLVKLNGQLELSEHWSSTSISGNAIYNRENNRGFAFGNGSGISTWFTYDGTLRRAIDCANNGSDITIHNRLEMSAVLDMNNNDIHGVDQIFHQGDTNTYMQFHAADQWRVVTGGAQRLEVNNSQTTISGGSASSALVISDDAPTMKFNDTGTGGDDFYIHINSNRFYILTDRDDSGAWEAPHPLQIDNDTEVMELYGNTVWHQGNDGAGSGLDADLLDGQHASAFAAASHSHSYASFGGSTFSGEYDLVVRISGNNIYSHPNIRFNGGTGTLIAPNFSGNGSSVTYLNASNLQYGKVPESRLPASALVGDTNYYLSGLSFNTGDGVLSATVNGTTNQSVDLDGRYLLSGSADTATKITFNQGVGVRREDNVYVTPTSFPKAVDFKFTQEGQLNSPPGSGSWAQLMTFQGWTAHNAAYPSYQMVFRNSAVSVRQSTSNTVWGGWRQLAETDGSYAGLRAQATTATDVGLGNVSNVSSNTANVANTNAQRNSSGDINARLFRSEYDSTNANVNYIMTQVDTASNNYIRPSTPAQVSNAMGIGSNATRDVFISTALPLSTDGADGDIWYTYQ